MWELYMHLPTGQARFCRQKAAVWINRDREKESKTPLLASLTVEYEITSLIHNLFKSSGSEEQKTQMRPLIFSAVKRCLHGKLE